MEEYWMAWGVALGVVIDLVVMVWVCRRIARFMEWRRERGTGPGVCDLPVDHDDAASFDSADDGGYSHGLLTNPATGVPMLHGVLIDAAGAPYGSDFGVSAGSCGLDTRCGGAHGW